MGLRREAGRAPVDEKEEALGKGIPVGSWGERVETGAWRGARSQTSRVPLLRTRLTRCAVPPSLEARFLFVSRKSFGQVRGKLRGSSWVFLTGSQLPTIPVPKRQTRFLLGRGGHLLRPFSLAWTRPPAPCVFTSPSLCACLCVQVSPGRLCPCGSQRGAASFTCVPGG